MASPAALRFPPRLRDLVRGGDARFVVTGAGGWLGRATLEMLDDALGDELPDRVHAFAARGRLHRLRSGREVELLALPELANLRSQGRPTVIAHYAFLTREKTAGMSADAYVDANRWITRFTTANAQRLGAAATFSTSSGAVYRPDGGLETSLADNPYGALKREEEEAFTALGVATGAKTVVCRVFNLAGPFLDKDYALGSIVEDVLAGRNIQIRAPHRVVRSYAHVRDVVTAGFASMLGSVDAPGAPFDTAGEDAVELDELARRAQNLLGRADLRIDRPSALNGREDRYVGNGVLFRTLVAQAGSAPASLDEGIRDTAAYLTCRHRPPAPMRAA